MVPGRARNYMIAPTVRSTTHLAAGCSEPPVRGARRVHLASLICGLAVVLAGCGAYEPPCRASEPTLLTTRAGLLTRHEGGRVALVSPGSWSGASRPVRVETFSSAGAALDAYEVDVPVHGFGAAMVDLPDGVAAASVDVRADAGTSLVVDLRRRDGGSLEVELPMSTCTLCSVQLAQVGALLQVAAGQDVTAIALDGGVVASRRAEGAVVAWGPDALAVAPGPRLLAPDLTPLSTAPVPPLDGVFAWDLAAGKIEAAATSGDADLLLVGADLHGAPTAPTRVTSGTPLALTTAGDRTALVFTGVSAAPGARPGASLWFALVEGGQKRGPDLPLPVDMAAFGGQVLIEPDGERFAIFSPSADGLRFVAVQCE